MKLIACAVVREDPPLVVLAEDQETLNWVLALKLIASIPAAQLPDDLREQLKTALSNEQWGDAVELYMSIHPEVDVYPSYELYSRRDVELAAHELEFSPLFAAE